VTLILFITGKISLTTSRYLIDVLIMFALLIFLFSLRLSITSYAQVAIIDDSEGPLEDPNLTPSNLQVQRCENELGMESGDISDDNLAVSSTVPAMNYGKEQARLNGDYAWAAYALPEQWIEVKCPKRRMLSTAYMFHRCKSRGGWGIQFLPLLF